MKFRAICCVFVIVCGGCSIPDLRQPMLEVWNPLNGQRFVRNSKDFGLHMKGMKVNPQNHQIEIESLDISNEASTVVAAQAALMAQYAEQMKIANQGLATVMDGIKSGLPIIAPLLQRPPQQTPHSGAVIPLPGPPSGQGPR